MANRRTLGGVVHTYQRYDPRELPSPLRPPPDVVSGAMEHMLAFGEMRELSDEELARAVRIDPNQIAGLGPSLDALREMLGVGTITILSSDTSDPKMVLPGIDNVRHIGERMDEARRRERMRRGLHIESV